MQKKKIYPHANHRQRVRDAFRKSGPGEMPDRNLLELLLFYSIPRRDTNEIADRLLKKYGSLSAVLNAPYDELAGIEGMGESSALLLTAIPAVSERLGSTYSPVKTLSEPGEMTKYVSGLFDGLCNEAFYVISLDAIGRAIGCRKLAEGDGSSVTVDKRAILEAVFSADADSVIIAHNHPGGASAPSADDIELTKETARLLGEMSIKLADHFIMGDDGILSLAGTAKFNNLFL